MEWSPCCAYGTQASCSWYTQVFFLSKHNCIWDYYIDSVAWEEYLFRPLFQSELLRWSALFNWVTLTVIQLEGFSNLFKITGNDFYCKDSLHVPEKKTVTVIKLMVKKVTFSVVTVAVGSIYCQVNCQRPNKSTEELERSFLPLYCKSFDNKSTKINQQKIIHKFKWSNFLDNCGSVWVSRAVVDLLVPDKLGECSF